MLTHGFGPVITWANEGKKADAIIEIITLIIISGSIRHLGRTTDLP
jgi:hypothetical protein